MKGPDGELTLADALAASDRLGELVDEFGVQVHLQRLAEIRHVLRRAGLTLRRALVTLETIESGPLPVRLCADIRDVLGDPPWDVEATKDGAVVPDKPVPHPADKTPVPDDHAETIRAVEEGRG